MTQDDLQNNIFARVKKTFAVFDVLISDNNNTYSLQTIQCAKCFTYS